MLVVNNLQIHCAAAVNDSDNGIHLHLQLQQAASYNVEAKNLAGQVVRVEGHMSICELLTCI